MARALVAIAATVAACAGAPAAEAGKATSVSCGDVITRDTRVANDLVDCPADGLVVGAPGITLDLAGHAIDGDGVAAAGEGVDVGIENKGHDRVTVQNGAVQEFDVGVSVAEVRHNRLRGLKVSGNAILGMDLDFSRDSEIEDSTFTANGAAFDGPGIFVVGSAGIVVEDNRVAGNGGTGLVQLQSSSNTVDGNSFVANADGGLFLGESGGSRVTRNLVARNDFAGIAVEADRNLVARNRLLENGDNIVLIGDANTVVQNEVAGARGCPDGCGFGISFEGGRDNLIANNRVLGSLKAGIRVASFAPETPEAIDNEVSRNVVLRAGDDGILVETSAVATLLAANLAIGAGDDGIDVDNADTTLTRNIAIRNRDLGIEAVPGVSDGGGNFARGNGNQAQCTEVDCGG